MMSSAQINVFGGPSCNCVLGRDDGLAIRNLVMRKNGLRGELQRPGRTTAAPSVNAHRKARPRAEPLQSDQVGTG